MSSLRHELGWSDKKWTPYYNNLEKKEKGESVLRVIFFFSFCNESKLLLCYHHQDERGALHATEIDGWI